MGSFSIFYIYSKITNNFYRILRKKRDRISKTQSESFIEQNILIYRKKRGLYEALRIAFRDPARSN